MPNRKARPSTVGGHPDTPAGGERGSRIPWVRRLQVIDPGHRAGRKPSSPNIPLNAAAALLLGLVLPILYLTLQMGLPGTARQRTFENVFHTVSKARGMSSGAANLSCRRFFRRRRLLRALWTADEVAPPSRAPNFYVRRL